MSNAIERTARELITLTVPHLIPDQPFLISLDQLKIYLSGIGDVPNDAALSTHDLVYDYMHRLEDRAELRLFERRFLWCSDNAYGIVACA